MLSRQKKRENEMLQHVTLRNIVVLRSRGVKCLGTHECREFRFYTNRCVIDWPEVNECLTPQQVVTGEVTGSRDNVRSSTVTASQAPIYAINRTDDLQRCSEEIPHPSRRDVMPLTAACQDSVHSFPQGGHEYRGRSGSSCGRHIALRLPNTLMR
jgi:hypothetical protein